MRFITNKQHGDMIRVQPEYKMTAECSTPIPNAEVNTPRRDLQGEILEELWNKSCETLQLIDRYRRQVKSTDFEKTDDYHESIIEWEKHAQLQQRFHEFVHSHYCATGWTEWKSISVDKCDTTSSTSTKEAS
tara:strand:+ start:2099 stop:2494 length:396 start_codon:yes stop_codon:yes gene_type:complete